MLNKRKRSLKTISDKQIKKTRKKPKSKVLKNVLIRITRQSLIIWTFASNQS